MRSIRWKIVILSVVVLIVPIILLSRYMMTRFDQFTRQNLEEQMIDVAFIVGEQYKFMSGADGALSATGTAVLSEAIVAYSAETGSRIQVLSSNGVVLADSASNTTVGANLSTLPEVAVALTGKYKARWSLTEDRSYMFYYVARPIIKEGRPVGVAYLSRSTSPIMKAIK